MPPHVPEPVGQPLREEPGRVGVHLVAEPLLGPLHADRDRAEGAVVEVSHGRVEREEQPGAGNRLGRIRVGPARGRGGSTIREGGEFRTVGHISDLTDQARGWA